MKRLLLTLALLAPLWGQQHIYPGGSKTSDVTMMTWVAGIPSGTCYSQFAINSTNGSIYTCPTTQEWVCVGGPDCAVPSGANILITSGTCPSGWSENTGLDGFTVIGTLNAHGNVGTSGGSNNITPAGTNTAPAFTGNSGTVPAEVISWPGGVPTFTGNAGTVPAQTFTGSSATTSSNSAGTPAGTNGASATTGNCAATNIAAGTNSTTACKATAPNLTVSAQTFTGSALAGHTHTLTATGTNGTAAFTPAGTVAWPAGVPTNATASFTPAGTVAAPAFSGNSFDNRSSFVLGIFCQRQ